MDKKTNRRKDLAEEGDDHEQQKLRNAPRNESQPEVQKTNLHQLAETTSKAIMNGELTYSDMSES